MHLFRESEVASGFFFKETLIAMASKSLHHWVPGPGITVQCDHQGTDTMLRLLTMMTVAPKTSHMIYEIVAPC